MAGLIKRVIAAAAGLGMVAAGMPVNAETKTENDIKLGRAEKVETRQSERKQKDSEQRFSETVVRAAKNFYKTHPADKPQYTSCDKGKLEVKATKAFTRAVAEAAGTRARDTKKFDIECLDGSPFEITFYGGKKGNEFLDSTLVELLEPFFNPEPKWFKDSTSRKSRNGNGITVSKRQRMHIANDGTKSFTDIYNISVKGMGDFSIIEGAANPLESRKVKISGYAKTTDTSGNDHYTILTRKDGKKNDALWIITGSPTLNDWGQKRLYKRPLKIPKKDSEGNIIKDRKGNPVMIRNPDPLRGRYNLTREVVRAILNNDGTISSEIELNPVSITQLLTKILNTQSKIKHKERIHNSKGVKVRTRKDGRSLYIGLDLGEGSGRGIDLEFMLGSDGIDIESPNNTIAQLYKKGILHDTKTGSYAIMFRVGEDVYNLQIQPERKVRGRIKGKRQRARASLKRIVQENNKGKIEEESRSLDCKYNPRRNKFYDCLTTTAGGLTSIEAYLTTASQEADSSTTTNGADKDTAKTKKTGDGRQYRLKPKSSKPKSNPTPSTARRDYQHREQSYAPPQATTPQSEDDTEENDAYKPLIKTLLIASGVILGTYLLDKYAKIKHNDERLLSNNKGGTDKQGLYIRF